VTLPKITEVPILTVVVGPSERSPILLADRLDRLSYGDSALNLAEKVFDAKVLASGVVMAEQQPTRPEILPGFSRILSGPTKPIESAGIVAGRQA